MTDRPRHRAFATTLLLGLLAAWSAAAVSPASATTDPVTLTLLATNDVHRRLVPVDAPDGWDHGLGGAALLASHLAAARERAPGALYVDAGDLTGSGGSGLGVPGGYADEATVEVMNQMGLDVTTAGNHEFDAGLDELRRLRSGGCWLDDCGYRHGEPYLGADFETLAANVVATATGEPVLPSWTIRESQGVQVGFVGATETGLSTEEGDGSLTFLEPYDAIAPAVEEVRAAGADVVVLLLHLGSRQHPEGTYDVNACEGIEGPSTWLLPWVEVDVVVDAHTHHAYVCDHPDLPLLTQASQRGVMFTEITLTYDRAAGAVVDRSATNHLVTPDRAPDAEVAAIVDRYRSGPADSGTTDPEPVPPPEPTAPEPEPTAPEPEPTAPEPEPAAPEPTAPTPTPTAPAPRPRTGGGDPATTVRLHDIDGTTHEAAIRKVAAAGITTGFSDGTFRPDQPVTRGQMATFLQRALDLAPGSAARLHDVGGHAHAAGIGAVARAGITTGFADGSFRPDDPVTRGQMATFLQRGLELPAGSAARFSDVGGHTHARGIGAVARAGITTGFPDGSFRPDGPVTRGQMASFLARARGL